MGVSIVDSMALGATFGCPKRKAAGQLDAPNTTTTQAAGSLAAPNVTAPEAQGSLAAPNVTTAAAEGSLAAPNVTNAQTQGSLTAPNELTTLFPRGINEPDPNIAQDGVAIVDTIAIGPGGELMPSGIGSLAAPNVFTPIAPQGFPYPFTHSRILYKNEFAQAAASPIAGQGVTVPNTFERWRPASGTQTLILTRPAPILIDAVAIGASVFNGATVTIEISPSASGAFTPIETAEPTDDRALMVLLSEPVTVQRIRVTLTGGSDREIGVIYAGVALQMERPLFGGHSPINLSARTDYQNQVSDSGNWLARSIVREGLETEYTFKYISDAWYRSEFQPFVISARREPFFVAWRPEFAPEDIAFAWTTADIKPTYSGSRDLIDLSFSVRGYGNS